MTSKSWIITINNYTDNDINWVKELIVNSIVVSKEVGENGTPHLQGYITFKTTKRLAGVKKLHDKAHWEICKNRDEAINYCRKAGTERVRDEVLEPRSRTDLKIVRDMLEEKKTNREIVKNITSISSVKAIDTIRYLMIEPRGDNERPEVIWLWGPPGCGKSKKAKEIFNHDYDDCDYANNFLIGYTGNDNVLLDDYRGQIPLYRLLKMLDYGKCTINVKNGQCFFGAKRVIITCPKNPEKLYEHICDENLLQLIRRINKIEYVTRDAVSGNTKETGHAGKKK